MQTHKPEKLRWGRTEQTLGLWFRTRRGWQFLDIVGDNWCSDLALVVLALVLEAWGFWLELILRLLESFLSSFNWIIKNIINGWGFQLMYVSRGGGHLGFRGREVSWLEMWKSIKLGWNSGKNRTKFENSSSRKIQKSKMAELSGSRKDDLAKFWKHWLLYQKHSQKTNWMLTQDSILNTCDISQWIRNVFN